MSETVKLILSLSVSGGLFALALFVLKPLMRNRLSKSFQYYIWLVVLLRFILPFTFGVNLMDYALNAPNEPQTVEEMVVPNNPVNPASVNSAANNAVNNNVPNITEQQPPMSITPNSAKPFDAVKTLTDNLLWIWLAGVVISAAWNVLGYLRFIRYVHGAAYAIDMPDGDAKVYKSRFAPTPMLVGMIRPRIYLPDIEYTDGQLNNILLHELTHLRRCDVWLKWFSALVVSVHWFNPIAYLMRREFNRACELSCDEAVIRKLDGAAKQNYGDTLISVVAESRYPVGVMSVTMCEEKKKLKERLIAIMNYKKKTKIAVLITAVLAVVITGTAFAFGAQWSGFNFWKSLHITIQLPNEKIFDISAADMEALILSKLDNPKTDIYIYSSQSIELETDYSLRFSIFEVLVSGFDKDGNLVRRVYQIGLSPENKTMTITHRDYAELVNSDFNYCRFSDFWNALSLLPADAIDETIRKEAPDYLTLRYTTHDVYANSSPEIKHIFYNSDRIINGYRETPSVMFNFTPMYQDENDPNIYEGFGAAILYYYHQQMDENFNISLADLRQLAAKGDTLQYSDFPHRGLVGLSSTLGGYNPVLYNVEGGYRLLINFNDTLNPESGISSTALESIWESGGSGIDIRYNDVDEFIRTHPSHPADTAPRTSYTPREWIKQNFDYSLTTTIDLMLDEFPDVLFSYTPEKLMATDENGEKELFGGTDGFIFGGYIYNLFLADLNGDGLPEFCGTTSWGSGFGDSRAIIYDYANDKRYVLSDRGTYDYFLQMENGQLEVIQTDAMQMSNMPRGVGNLAIINGELVVLGIDRTAPVTTPKETTPPIKNLSPTEIVRQELLNDGCKITHVFLMSHGARKSLQGVDNGELAVVYVSYTEGEYGDAIYCMRYEFERATTDSIWTHSEPIYWDGIAIDVAAYVAREYFKELTGASYDDIVISWASQEEIDIAFPNNTLDGTYPAAFYIGESNDVPVLIIVSSPDGQSHWKVNWYNSSAIAQ